MDFTVSHARGTALQYRLRIESNSTRTDISEFVQLLNTDSNQFDTIGFRTLGLNDTTANYFIGEKNIAELYVSVNTEVFGRVRYIPQADLESADGWAMTIDQIRSEVSGF